MLGVSRCTLSTFITEIAALYLNGHWTAVIRDPKRGVIYTMTDISIIFDFSSALGCFRDLKTSEVIIFACLGSSD